MKCSWCGENVGKGHKVEMCKKYNKPVVERFLQTTPAEHFLDDALLLSISKTLFFIHELLATTDCSSIKKRTLNTIRRTLTVQSTLLESINACNK
jgi:hypothetical protein